MLRSFLNNHVLANVTFVVVLVIGTISYLALPRAKDPEINFNWISVMTAYPGASAEDVEKLISKPLEDAIQQVSDVKFVSSDSREGMSNILVRFESISDNAFDKRLNDMRREVQNKTNAELPSEAKAPLILEITTANSFPTAVVVVRGEADDELLRRTAKGVKQDIERIKGVDGLDVSALHDPELQVDFDAQKLQSFGITPTQLMDSIGAHFKDVSAGDADIGNRKWLVRLIGTDADPGYIAKLPIITARGVVSVDSLADVSRGRKSALQLVLHDGKPSVMMAVKKKANANTLDMVSRIEAYITDKNKVLAQQGMDVVLLDDQTTPTREAINVMESNALLGLALVMVVTWLFLGTHMSIFIGLCIPFTLAATFWVLDMAGQTLNQSVLLGIVIVLGMLVDDSVVVVESIYYRLQRGMNAMQASIDSLAEVFKPVTASVLTTVAAFMPLMLLPGIIGDFMFVIPFVVTVALLISLLEAYWLLPAHIIAAKVRFDRPSRIHGLRQRYSRVLRLKYAQSLVWVLRRPALSLGATAILIAGAVGLVASGAIKTQFFAFDAIRMFYVNVQMAPGTPIDETLRVTALVEQKVRKHMVAGELRETASVAGQMFTETAPFFGDRYGQVVISLRSRGPIMRDVSEIVEAMREDVVNTPGPSQLSFLVMSGGPPTSKPINVKVRGDDYTQLRAATDALAAVLKSMPAVKDISDDDSPGKPEIQLRLDADAVKRAGLNAGDLARMIRLLFDGEVVASMQHEGDKLDVRVRAKRRTAQDIEDLLRQSVALPDGGQVALGQLVTVHTDYSKSNIRHYNFRRAITLEADLDKQKLDTVAANAMLKKAWETMRLQYSGIDLDFSGELDDIEESLNSMGVLFVFGVGLMYLILGTQFRSYFQPLMILATVPMAFAGVAYGLAVTGDPLSLFTIYGVVALAGVAVNSAIVLIDAANSRLDGGMSIFHATVYSARRRLIPILITSLTTIAGLFSLAAGWGGKSLVWGPVASAIVWGLGVSTVLTLYIIPLLYRLFMARSANSRYAPAH